MRRRILTTLLCYSLLLPATARASNREVGIFLQADKNCAILDATGQVACSKGRTVLDGDILVTTGDPAKLPVQWISKSVTFARSAPDRYRVSYQTPAEKRGVVGRALDAFSFTRSAARTTAMAATRAAKPLQPGKRATLLPGQATTFAGWNAGAKRLLITDHSGETVCVRALKGLTRIDLLPENAGLRPGASYRWRSEGGKPAGGELLLLDQETATAIDEAFAAIDADPAFAGNDKVFAKAVVALLLSGDFPGEVSLYWLAYQLVEQLPVLSDPEEQKLANRLLLDSQKGMKIAPPAPAGEDTP